MSLEIRPLALYPLHPPIKSVLLVAGGGMLMHLRHFILYQSKYGGGGYNAAMGLISRDIALKSWALQSACIFNIL